MDKFKGMGNMDKLKGMKKAGKTRVGVKLKDALGKKQSHNESESLKVWTDRYHVFMANLKEFVRVLQIHRSNMIKINESKLQVRFVSPSFFLSFSFLAVCILILVRFFFFSPSSSFLLFIRLPIRLPY